MEWAAVLLIKSFILGRDRILKAFLCLAQLTLFSPFLFSFVFAADLNVSDTAYRANSLTADFNGDGVGDIVYQDPNSLEWHMDLIGAGSRVRHIGSPTLDFMSSCCGWTFNGIGDFDGNGSSDILIRNTRSGQWYQYLFEQGALQSKGYVLIRNAVENDVQAVADFNGDGKSDVLLRNEITGEWSISFLDGRSLLRESKPAMSKVLAWELAGAKDFDGNGSPDILIRNKASGGWYIYLYEKDTIIHRGYVEDLPGNLDLRVVGIGDFNGDARADVMLRDLESGMGYVYFMEGANVSALKSTSIFQSSDWQVVAINDYDGNSIADVLLKNRSNNNDYTFALWDEKVSPRIQTGGAFVNYADLEMLPLSLAHRSLIFESNNKVYQAPPPEALGAPLTNRPISGYKGVLSRAVVGPHNATNIVEEVTVALDVLNVLSFADEHQINRFDSLINTYGIGHLGDCSRGEIQVDVISGNKANVTYVNCESGPYVINGSGQLLVNSTDANGDLVSGSLDYQGLKITNNNNSKEYEFGGVVDVDLRDPASVVFEGLLTDSSGNQAWLNNLMIGYQYSGDAGYFIKGDIYLSNYGNLDISTLIRRTSFDHGAFRRPFEILLSGTQDLNILMANNTLSVSLSGYTQSLNYQDLLNPTSSAINRAPIARINNTETSVIQFEPLQLDASSTTDADQDLLLFTWEIISAPKNAEYKISERNSMITEATFDTAGEYTISVSVQDKTLISVKEVALRVLKPYPQGELVGTPETITLGTDVKVEVLNNSPSSEGPFSISLAYGPSSMKINDQGILEWDGRIPDLAQNIEVSFGVEISNGDTSTVLEEQIFVKSTSEDPSSDLFSGRSEVIDWQDINADGLADALVFSGGVLKAIDFSGKSPAEVFRIETGTRKIKLAHYLMDQNEVIYHDEYANEIVLFDVDNKSERRLEGLHLRTFMVDDIDKNGSWEIITNAEVYAQSTLEVLKTFQNTSFATEKMASGDVNGDGVSDILTDDRLIDGSTGFDLANLESFRTSWVKSLTNHIVDLDHDGKAEIIRVADDIQVLKWHNDEIILHQIISSEDWDKQSINAAFSTDFNQFFASNSTGNELLHYVLSSETKFEFVNTVAVTDPDLRVGTNSQYNGCAIQSVFSSQREFVLQCFLLGDTNNFPGIFPTPTETLAKLKFDNDIKDLPLSYALNSEFVLFSQINSQDANLSVGSFNGVLEYNIDGSSLKHIAPPGTSVGNTYADFRLHTLEGTEAYGWAVPYARNDDSELINFDILGNTSKSLALPSQYSLENVFQIAEEDYGLVKGRDNIKVIRLSDLSTELVIPYTENNFSGDTLHGSAVFDTLDNEIILVLWIGDELITATAKDQIFSEHTKLFLPSVFVGTSASVGDVFIGYLPQSQQVFLYQLEKGKLSKLSFNLESQEVNYNEEVMHNTTLNYSQEAGTKACVSTESSSKNIYFYANTLNESDKGNIRPGRIYALDMVTDKAVWQSNRLGGSASYAGAHDMHCDVINDKERIAITAGSRFTIYH